MSSNQSTIYPTTANIIGLAIRSIIGCGLSALPLATPLHAGSLKIQFTNFTEIKGKLYVALCNASEQFLSDTVQPFRKQVVHVTEVPTSVSFDNIPVGNYAVTAFQDLNANDALDTKFFVIPAEPIGVSNNVQPAMGPPKYGQALFKVTNEDKSITINMQH